MSVNLEVIQWAIDKAGLNEKDIAKKLSINTQKVILKEKDIKQLTFNEVKKISNITKIPYGYFFLDKPPKTDCPIPDFRTPENQSLNEISLNLQATIYDAQRKQRWLREYLVSQGTSPLSIKNYRIEELPEKIRDFIELDKLKSQNKSTEKFLSALIEKLTNERFILLRNGVVGNNTNRPLYKKKPKGFSLEFKGFALYDEHVPLIFINGKDYKSSQVFTLVHELVHIFMKESGLDGDNQYDLEQKINRIAAEALIPEEGFEYTKIGDEEKLYQKYRVSRFVVLLRARHLKLISYEDFNRKWKELVNKITDQKPSKGGNFYNNVKFRGEGGCFLSSVISSTLEGKTLFRDCYALTGLSDKTFSRYVKSMGFSV